jgi:RAT1-interacting protein
LPPGYKFETLSTLPATWGETSREYIENRDKEVVSNKAQYCSVVRTGIGKTILCIGGEVDAGMWLPQSTMPLLIPPLQPPHNVQTDAHRCLVWDAKPMIPGAPTNWVELKTSASIRDDRDMNNFERKLMKFWIQSFLLGVPKIIVGFRSQNGILEKLEEIKTESIPVTAAQRGVKTWNANMCINFGAGFLECECQLFSKRPPPTVPITKN